MDLMLTVDEIWQIAVVKLLFYVFIGLGILFYFKVKKPALFIGLIAGFLGASYLVLIYGSQLTWWGLQGDEIFVTAFLQKMAAGQFFSDFFYSGLPPFYHPFYFWLVGLLAWVFKLNGIVAAQLGVTLTLFLAPFIFYYWQKAYWQTALSHWQLILSTAIIFVVADWTAVILKPYEFISAVLVVFWTAFLLTDLEKKKIDLRKIIFYGVTGGLIFMTYYFWFLPIAVAITIFKLFSKIDIKSYFTALTAIAIIAVIVSLPFLAPLIFSYLSFGSENWSQGYFVIEYLDFYLPFFEFTIFGLVSLVGLLSLIFYWSKPYIKALATIFGTMYIWQFINLLTIIFWQVSFLPAKPFLFLGGAVLSISAAYGISLFINQKVKTDKARAGLFIFGWIFLASQLLGGSFIDKADTQKQLVIMKQPLREEFVNLITNLEQVAGLENLTILSSGMPQISAYLPLDYFISYNIHFSHPAASFSQRHLFVVELAASLDSDEFYKKLATAPFGGIDALLFFKAGDYYPIIFGIDNYPLGVAEEEIKISTNLINDQYFVKVFEDEQFVFFKLKP